MQIHDSMTAGGLTGAVVLIGNFDGVHVGHRVLFARARALADRLGAEVAVLTFWPHPARLFAPSRAPALLTSRERRAELFAELGAAILVEQRFDDTFAATSAEGFLAALLERSGAAGVVVGHDFTFGKGRTGNVDTLRAACARHGVALDVVEAVSEGGLTVSSTRIRSLLAAGDVSAAAALLGRPHDLDGEVVHGAARGRTIGFPTANLACTDVLVPRIGIYAVRMRLPGGEWADGAGSIGRNPTFTAGQPGAPVTVEVHLLDRTIDLYGANVRVAFVRWLRDEIRFGSVEALVGQIRRDVSDARVALTIA